MDSANDALAAMGIDPDEAIAVDESLRERPGSRDGRVCICGHGVGRHTVEGGAVYCKPARMECLCKKVRPVVDAEDTRPFLRKTAGAGPMHALTRGLAALAALGKKAEWIVPLECDKCGDEARGIVPVPVTQQGIISSEATGFDVLLCPNCRVS